MDSPSGWAGGWASWGELEVPALPEAEIEVAASPTAAASPKIAASLLRLSEDFVAGDSPKLSPAPCAQPQETGGKGKAKAKKAKARRGAKPQKASSDAGALTRRLKLGTVTPAECGHVVAEAEPAAPSATETAPAEPEPAATVQPRPFEEPGSMIVVCEDDPSPAGGGEVAHAAAEQAQTSSPQLAERPSGQTEEFMARKLGRRGQRPGANERPASAASVSEFSIPIDRTPWTADAEQLDESSGANGRARSAGRICVSSKGRGVSRGRSAPRTPGSVASSAAGRQAQLMDGLDGCSPTGSVSPSHDKVRANCAKATCQRERSQLRSVPQSPEQATPAPRRCSTSHSSPQLSAPRDHSPAARASAAVAAALGRLEVDRPQSREAVRVAREVRGEMQRWLRNVDNRGLREVITTNAPQKALSAVAGPQSVAQCTGAQREGAPRGKRGGRAHTPDDFPSLAAARTAMRQRETVSAGGEQQRRVLPALRRPVAKVRHVQPIDHVTCTAVQGRVPWGQLQGRSNRVGQRPKHPRRVAAPWGGGVASVVSMR